MIPLWILIVVAIFAIIIAGVVLLSIYENKQLSVEFYEICSEKIPQGFDGYRIVFLTDLHCREFGDKNEKLLEAIAQCKPDVVLIGGDMVVSRENSTEEVPLRLLKDLAKEYPVYYADGNHELRLARNEEIFGVRYKDYIHKMKEYDVQHMSNETIVLAAEDGFISLTAFDLEKKFYHRFHVPQMTKEEIETAIGEHTGKVFQILLVHNPNYMEAYADFGSDLVLSGHFHGGMVRIPGLGGVISPQFQIFPKYDAGEFRKKNTTMIVSRGLGNHSIKLRVFNRPEISVITLKKQRSGHGD